MKVPPELDAITDRVLAYNPDAPKSDEPPKAIAGAPDRPLVISDIEITRYKYHQWFTPEHGHPKLRGHLEGAMALIRIFSSWRAFRKNLDIAYRKQNLNRELPFGAD